MTSLQFLDGENLACVRGGRLVFRDVDFRVARGEILQVEGSNGSGKTSLLRLIAGLLAPAAGAIRLDAASDDDAEKRRELIGWLGHQDGVKSQLTPRETLAFFAGVYGTSDDVDAALEAVGLARAADLPCQYLSAGQKRRLSLARLKLTNRPLWLLDEPLAALDTQGKSLIADMLRGHADAGGISIAATHEPLGVDAARLQLS